MTHPFLSEVLRLVEQAGEAILPWWRQPLEIREKADASPVTAADLAAHHCLAAGLGRLDPQIPVLSEEDCGAGLARRAAWSRWWLVDPLDGTREFIAGSGEFTVNVALIDRGQVVFGVVGAPAAGCCYYGGRGLGAGCLEQGRHRVLQVSPPDSQPHVLVASRRHGSPAQQQLVAGLQARFPGLEMTSIGSSLKFCLVADGRADCYPRLAPTSQWDTAAAQGVLEGAGGQVLTVTGQPLAYAAREDYLNPGFLALPAGAPWQAALLELARQAG